MIGLAAQSQDVPPLPIESFVVSDQAVIDHAKPRMTPHPTLTLLQASSALAERPNIPHTYVLAGVCAEKSKTFAAFHKKFQDEKIGDARIINTGPVMMLTDPAGTLEILQNAK